MYRSFANPLTFAALLTLAAPAATQAATPPSSKSLPACSARITDNCIQHEPGSQWYKEHHKKGRHHMVRHHKKAHHKASHRMIRHHSAKHSRDMDDHAMHTEAKPAHPTSKTEPGHKS